VAAAGPGAPTVPGPRRRSAGVAAVAGGAIVLALVVGSAAIGPVAIPSGTVLAILAHEATGGAWPGGACPGVGSSSQCAIWVEIVWDARVPALLLALVAGGALGLSGATLQGVFRNPLADPYLLGLSSGAALGASALYTFGWFAASRAVVLPAAAFLGGLVPGTIVVLAARSGRRSPETLLLTGVALNALFASILASFLLYNPAGNIPLSFWLLGGLGDASWTHDALVASVLLVGGAVLVGRGAELNLLQLGPDVARSLGVDARALTRLLILAATLLTAGAVAFTGVVGFVGLVAPHIVRRTLGVDYRRVLPFAALTGGIFLLVAWDIAQVVVPDVVIPVGIPTAFAGALFFLYLLQRRDRSGALRGDAT